MNVQRMKLLLVKGAFWAGCALLLWAFGRYLIGWFLPFLAGFLIAYLLRPPARFIAKHSRMSARGASIVSAVLFYAVLGGLLWMLGAYLLGRVQQLGERLPELYETGISPILQTINKRIGEITGQSRIAGPIGAGATGALDIVNDALSGAASSASQWGVELVGKIASRIPMAAIGAIFTIVSSVLICADYEKVCTAITGLIPPHRRALVLEARDHLLRALGKTAKAYLILMIITFAGLTLGLWLLRIRLFWVASGFIALLDFLPVIGSGAVLLPWAGYFFLTGQTRTGFGMVALWVAVSILREVLEPKIVGGQIGLHPLAVITAMYAGLKIAGVWGLILAPIACLLLRYLYERGLLPIGGSADEGI